MHTAVYNLALRRRAEQVIYTRKNEAQGRVIQQLMKSVKLRHFPQEVGKK